MDRWIGFSATTCDSGEEREGVYLSHVLILFYVTNYVELTCLGCTISRQGKRGV
jgi:hypothetical protein